MRVEAAVVLDEHKRAQRERIEREHPGLKIAQDLSSATFEVSGVKICSVELPGLYSLSFRLELDHFKETFPHLSPRIAILNRLLEDLDLDTLERISKLRPWLFHQSKRVMFSTDAGWVIRPSTVRGIRELIELMLEETR